MLYYYLFFSEIEFEMVEKLSDSPAKWWDPTCDKSLLIGVYKHGELLWILRFLVEIVCYVFSSNLKGKGQCHPVQVEESAIPHAL